MHLVAFFLISRLTCHFCIRFIHDVLHVNIYIFTCCWFSYSDVWFLLVECLSLINSIECWCCVSVKYLGLMAMSKILKTHPKSVQAHKDLILQCLDDKDESIRLRALDLLYGMVLGYFILFSDWSPSSWCVMNVCSMFMHLVNLFGPLYTNQSINQNLLICNNQLFRVN